MRTKQNQYQADRVAQFYAQFSPSRKETYAHFSAEEIASATISRILKRIDERGTSTYSEKRGFAPTVVTDRMVESVRKLVIKDNNIPLRSIAARLNISKTSVEKCKKKAKIKTRVCAKVPAYKDDHIERCKSGAAVIANQVRSGRVFILDDECYCYQDPSQIAGRKYVHIVPGVETPQAALVHVKTKFAKKFGVWTAIASNGLVSPPVFITGTMNADEYLEKCLKPVMLPWIEANFDARNVVFWPDLARYHYSKEVLAYLAEQGIEVVSKENNPPNLPQCRPIERYWSLVKRKMRRYKQTATSLKSFSRRWRICSMEVVRESAHKLFDHFIERLESVKEDGPVSFLTKRMQELSAR